MRELFFKEGAINSTSVIVRDVKDIHHVKNVFRKKIGDALNIIDDKYRYYGRISKITSDVLEIEIDKKVLLHENLVEIECALALIKNDKMQLAISKLAEIGITRLIPLVTQHCVVKLSEKKSKWDTIALETLKQCGGDKPLEISKLCRLESLDFQAYDLIIVAYETEKDITLKTVLKDTLHTKRILYIIGPEGGFDLKEIEFLEKNGAVPITLGKNILRAETAAIVLGGVLKYEIS